MAKRTGLGNQFWVCQIGSGPAFNVSNDIGAIDQASTTFASMDSTGIDKSAHERLPLQGDGALQFTSFWNNATGGSQQVIRPLNGLAMRAIWGGTSTEGDGLAYALNGIMDDYNPTRAANGSLMAKPKVSSYNGDFPDWGVLAVRATDASGTVNHTAIDLVGTASGQTSSVFTISGNTNANPTVVTTTAPVSGIGALTNGDSVNITGSNSTPSINGDWVVSGVSGSTFTVPVNCSVSGTSGSVFMTSTRLGGVIVALLISIGSGTNYTLQVQTSADNGSNDAYANVASLVTSSLTAAAAESRVRVNNVLIKRWIRVVGAGTYTNANVVALVKRFQGTE